MSKSNIDFFKEKKVWSEIKDNLLGCYLVPYFSKIIGTGQPILYIDGFAGKGMFDDGNAGSPIIALRIINNCIEKTNFDNVRINSCFIELKHTESLKENTATFSNVEVISGRYEDNIEKVLYGKENYNVFIYIDPYGIKSLHFSIFSKLKSMNLNSVEVLMNMNSFGFIREACNAMSVKFDIKDLDDVFQLDEASNDGKFKSIEDLNKVAGGVYWQDIISDYKKGIISGYEAEKRFAEEYCQSLKDVFTYVLNMPIRLKKGQRPKYRMIYATNHEDGCVLMNDNMCKRWEALENIQNKGQMTIFQEDVENNSIDEDVLYNELYNFIKEHPIFIDINVFHAQFFIKSGVRYTSSQIVKQLKKMEEKKLIEVKRTPSLTARGKASSFWTASNKNSIRIRWRNEKSN